ncbi:MAG TPA: hypothetical protein VKY74_24990 [Chloroflexia bacterium]|nr:hypothetical protein [Chloroflexia bacterium]
MLASGGFDGRVQFWQVPAAQPVGSLSGHTGSVWELVFTPDGHLLASGGQDGTIRLWGVAGEPPTPG